MARYALDEQGYTVIEAGDGAEALAVLNAGTKIDLLVTDVGLPASGMHVTMKPVVLDLLAARVSAIIEGKA